LAFFNRKAKKVEPRSALVQSLFWIALSLGFGVLIYLSMGQELATQYLSAYVTEKMLSVDNLFVIMLIFSFFKLEEKYHHKVLFWGIIGAIVFRAIFIGAGTLVIERFSWILYIFGAILLVTGIKLFQDKKEEHVDLSQNKTMLLAKEYLPFTTNHHNGRFLVKENGKLLFTTLFMIVLLVETTDIIFAFDSIPAAFAISQRAFIIFTSNIFAIMGLRALFFLLEGILHKFHHLQKGLAFILVFIGAKMLLGIFDIHLSSITSFGVIIAALLGSLWLSVLFPKKV
jgi:tellurite resistance protein TerC